MSIVRSMSIGASGLRSHSDALDVVGDNIANANTVGFKRGRAIFEDLLGRSIAGANAIPTSGAGSRLAHVEQMWTQGALLTTNQPTDLAISGDGFFMVKGNVDGVNGNFYSRAGQFSVDKDGYVVNPDGLRLQGYQADAAGKLAGVISDLQIAGGTMPAQPTTTLDVQVNLDSSSSVPTGTWDPTNITSDSYNFSTSTTIYDSLGNSHEMTVYYRKTADNAWEWHGVMDGGELNAGTAGTTTEVASGTLAFGTAGELLADTATPAALDFAGGATPGQAVTIDFGTSVADGGTGFEDSTQYASDSTNEQITNDGWSSGSVTGVQVESDGTITGVFSNGENRTLGQVALASFTATGGLERAGHNVWVETERSGEPAIGAAGAGGRGAIVSGSLESSNVDIGQEFVDLIAYQRGFQANSKIISTADEMYQELVNLKR